MFHPFQKITAIQKDFHKPFLCSLSKKITALILAGAMAAAGGAFGFYYSPSLYEDDTAVAALSSMGSRGSEVKAIQQALKDRGLYNGSVDGIFGSATQKAVIQFQKQSGLAADGIAGPQTLKKLGITIGTTPSATESNIYLLARIISAEARGEVYSGQVAVGAVILNRIKHPSFPDTLSGVIYQPGAFTAITDGQFNEPVADSAYSAARDALNGVDPSGGAIYYYNPDKTSNQWIRSRPVIKRIGNHLFCS